MAGIGSNQFTTGFGPSGGVCENPPRFTWPMREEVSPYALEVSADRDFSDVAMKIEGIPYNFFTPDSPLKPGGYFWRVNSDAAAREFAVGSGLPETPLPDRRDRFGNAKDARPRLWLDPEKIRAYREDLAKAKNEAFEAFFANSVLPRIKEGFPKEPERYPNDVRVIDLWRKNYMTCQQALCYIRSLSVAGVIKQDAELVGLAKTALMELAGWDYSLETSSSTRLYNDECAYRVGYALAYGFDWLHGHMDEGERAKVRASLYERTKEIAEYAIIEKKIHNMPYDSHAIRSLSMLMIPCCISLLDFAAGDAKHEDALEWLNYSLEYISALYTPWGGLDGGWAEGPMYWTTGQAFMTEALGLVKNYLGYDFFRRPFFRATGDYPLHCYPPGTYRASFGDQSNLGLRPGPKTAFNMRVFAGNTGNGLYQWYFNKLMGSSEMAPEHFSDKGWWDLYYDDLVYRHDYAPVDEVPPKPGTTVKHFRDIGWVAINKDMADSEKHVFFLIKSSPYGSLSHSQADQNSFCLFAYNQPLIIVSGYYGGYASPLHLNWRKQTRSANSILIDGLGQYAGLDFEAAKKARAEAQDITAGEEKFHQFAAKGKIVGVEETDGQVLIVADATEAYKKNVPYLDSYVRRVCWRDGDRGILIKIVDSVALSQKGRVSVLYHALKPFDIDGRKGFGLKVGDVSLTGAVASSSGIENIAQSDKFDGVPEEDYKDLERNYRISIETSENGSHEIVTELSFGK